jgi:phosphoribosylformylglycinamidine synthase
VLPEGRPGIFRISSALLPQAASIIPIPKRQIDVSSLDLIIPPLFKIFVSTNINKSVGNYHRGIHYGNYCYQVKYKSGLMLSNTCQVCQHASTSFHMPISCIINSLMAIIHLYRKPALTESGLIALRRICPSLESAESEFCYNVGVTEPLDKEEFSVLTWLLRETFQPEGFADSPFLKGNSIIEAGPRLSFQTAWSTNAVSVCRAVGLRKVYRLERSRRYIFTGKLTEEERTSLVASLYDKMTETVYESPLESFDPGVAPEPVEIVPVLDKGRAAIEEINKRMGLGLDDWDLDYYTDLFTNIMKKDPTNVECFDLGQSNSEHSRHWFFKGRLVIDGEEMPDDLMTIVARPYKLNRRNSVIAFSDNSSSIRGYRINTILPEAPGLPSAYTLRQADYDIIFTAETHNFPSGVAPFPGAETGTGGRIRDVQGVGRGGLTVAGTAAYCVGNLDIPGYPQPWEPPQEAFKYPGNLASPLQILIDASNGASDYGNKYGEPMIQGYTRAFGMRLPGGERREWIKPIMFTAGMGQMDAAHVDKGKPGKDMIVTKVGGPAYRIGMGGGAASSMVQGENVAELDFNAVQRGDAEMEQKMNRVVRACVEMGDKNPIVSMHDQGAGGNCNVVKELIEPEGAEIDIRNVELGDQTMSVLEIWGAEYQENDALLLKPRDAHLFRTLCEREKVPCSFLGHITGDGRIVVRDSLDDTVPVDLDLRYVLAEMPRKTFQIKRENPVLKPIDLPDISVTEALHRVLRLISVGSKRFLTNKVDRSVTGLIAQQQCAGPLGLTVSDVAVIAQSHFKSDSGALTGAATAIGEQPIKGLINAGAMARMSVAEALTNIVWARLTHMEDIRCSANWMWAAKLPGEGAVIYDAAVAMSDFMTELMIAVDGGKDSLSMATLVPESNETVKSPGALVISAYCTTEDITKTRTPDIKDAGASSLIYIDLGRGKCRLGGSALAQVYGQLGDESPDIEDPALLKGAFMAVQELLDKGLILAGHDVSDGGLIVTLLEMAFSGNCGLDISMSSSSEAATDPLSLLFSEEAGLVFEVKDKNLVDAEKILKKHIDSFFLIGRTHREKRIKIAIGGSEVLDADMLGLRSIWEETSYELEKLQMNPAMADEERKNVHDRPGPGYNSTSEPAGVSEIGPAERIPVAIIREEGSNGDREMASAFYAAGFTPHDIVMSDLLSGRAMLEGFRGVVFVGGFSYADVLDSAKGWSAAIRFNDKVRDEFDAFYERPDTFSLGVCNGCQLMALLGWVPWRGLADEIQPRFIHNDSGRFESRFSTVRIHKSPSIMLKGMEGSVLGAWVAHGEGKLFAPDKGTLEEIIAKGLAPVRYADDTGDPTTAYPFNPNGSPEGITGLCSPDGRHLAMMPHPERAFMNWQWPWTPQNWDPTAASPWMRMFRNAYDWCRGDAK